MKYYKTQLYFYTLLSFNLIHKSLDKTQSRIFKICLNGYSFKKKDSLLLKKY